MIKNINEIVNIVLTIFIFYYLMNNVFHINPFESTNNLNKDFFTSRLNSLIPTFLKQSANIQEKFSNIKESLEHVDNKVDKIQKEIHDNKDVVKTPDSDMKSDMIDHLNQVINEHDKTTKECSDDDYIYSNYIPSSKDGIVEKYSNMDSSQISNLVKMNLDVGEVKKVKSDGITNIPNYKTDNDSNAFVNNMNSYCNENQLSGGDISGLYPFDSGVSEYESIT